MHFKSNWDASFWESLWHELVRAGPFLVALGVGFVAAYVAWQQYRVARAKLNLELFERRFKLYMILWTFLSHQGKTPIQLKTAALKEDRRDFETELHNARPEFYFLFGTEIGEFALTAQKLALRLSLAFLELQKAQPDTLERRKLETELAELEQWFLTEVNGLRDRFAPYMDFKEWRGHEPWIIRLGRRSRTN